MEDILKQNIIKDIGLDSLPEEEQKEAFLKIGEIIFSGVLSRVLDELSDEEASEFEKIISETPDDEEAVMGFMKAKVPNLDEIVNEEITKFKKESVDFMDEISE
jgi:succinate dehydrogenase flavin-adding protein (antitoxin of CptAB toxin-antitoxin module)